MVYKEARIERVLGKDSAAVLAHEIRNPLALIKANLQYVELCNGTCHNKRNFEVIYREIDRINEILSDYIEASKPDTLKLKRFYIEDLLCEAEEIFSQVCTRSGIALTIVNKERLEVRADYNKIKQVLINVLQNAIEGIEALRRPDGKIEVSADKSGGFAYICVKDNGIGISDADIGLAGTPYFTSKEKGSGLGLSISKEIMRVHKGSLTISRTEKKGVCVTISLPTI